MSTAAIYNYLQVDDDLCLGGQPTEAQLRAAAAEGFVTVINLATLHPDDALQDEAGLVQALGLTYIHLPVAWGNPRPEDFAAFERAFSSRPAGKTLLHCAANYRATAFYGLYAQKHLGWSEAQAEVFRAQIWAGSNYPVWEQFIAHIRAQLNGPAAGSAR